MQTLNPGYVKNLLQGPLRGQLRDLIKSREYCNPPVGPAQEVIRHFDAQALVLFEVSRAAPKTTEDGHGPSIQVVRDTKDMVLFESGEFAVVRTVESSGTNNIFTYGVGEYIENTYTELLPLSPLELAEHSGRIGDELRRRSSQ
jgi:hypothetical protein